MNIEIGDMAPREQAVNLQTRIPFGSGNSAAFNIFFDGPDLASVRFKDGATGLLDLLDAQRVQLQAEDAYAESHSNSALSAVLLYKSLARRMAANSSSGCETRKTLSRTHSS
jgi:hypothetical protein